MTVMRRSRHWTRASFEHGAILCCLLVVSLGFNNAGSAHDEASSVALYRAESFMSNDILKLNPTTLADESTPPATGLDPSIKPGTVIFSRDGNTLVGVTPQSKVIVQRGFGGPVVSTFSMEGQGFPLALNLDGSRLLVTIDSAPGGAPLESPTWRVFATDTGEELSSFEVNSLNTSGLPYAVDPVSWKAYRIVLAQHPVDDEAGPWPTVLVALDLMTGREIGRLELTDAMGGSWGDISDSDPRGYSFAPGLAVSPDGNQLAIVHATDDGITLVDAATMKVSRTLKMKPKVGLFDQLFALLPLAPQKAAAKGSQGTYYNATYAGDGRQLYVSGMSSNDEDSDMMLGGLGLSVVDLDNREIEARVLDGYLITFFSEAPDDGGVFLTAYKYDGKGGDVGTYELVRLDPDSFDVTATRSLHAWTSFFIVPSPES
jgi:hypothetical protein